ADALEYAHRHSVIHRDVKPENILLRDDHALVMDFGIALAVAQAGGERITQTGTSLGTPQYMAPEQAMGDRHLDGRVDVYALGVVTYEMLVGEAPFTGPTAQAIIARVMTEEPRSLVAQRHTVPAAIEAAVLTAIEKIPADRFSTPAEFRHALTASAPVQTRRAPAPVARARRDLVWGGVAVAIAVAGFMAGRGGSGARSPVASFGKATKVTWERGLEIEPALSPDGRSVAYAKGTSVGMRIYVRQVAGGRSIPLTDDAEGNQTNPQWSGDGSRIYFLTDGGLSSAPSAGGAARPEMPAPGRTVISAAPAPDGSSIAYAVGDSVYLRAAGGQTRSLAPVREASLCQWSPAGGLIACASGNTYYSRLGPIFGNLAPSRIVIIRAADGAVIPATDSVATNHSPVWSGDGRWIYFVSNRLGPFDIYAAPVDRNGNSGRSIRLTTGLGAHDISVTRSGTRFAFDNLVAATNIWSVPFPPTGAIRSTARALTSGAQVVEGISLSRDGSWLYYPSDVSGTSELYREHLPNPALPFLGPGEPEQLTFDTTNDFSPTPSPDGRELAFHSFRSGSRDLYLLPLDGGPVQTVTATPRQESQPDWAPDGRALVYCEFGVPGGIWVVRRDSTGTWGRAIQVSPYGSWPVWSPDGRFIAFTSNLLGGSLMVVGPGPERARVVLDSAKGLLVETPKWAPDGRTIYFKSHDAAGHASFWAESVSGGAPRLVMRLDDPDFPSYRPEWALGGGRAYFGVNDRQSDIWVMEVIPR
ncbi:MAG TPA: protein kinase, partial [Gemmatimonadales bacterium]|nr:protein kinase [Gemmatimonadales bacterium]